MKIVVIGGGASGMAAAITAARSGAEVVLFEKEERLGRKIPATGNGKCNFSNNIYEGNEYNENASEFVKAAFEEFSPQDTLKFFDELGIYPRFESEGRIYPASEQASSVLDVLRMEIERLSNIEVVYNHWIKGIVVKKIGGFAIVSHKNMRLSADKVIIACGGRAGAQYGCEGDGHALAEMLAHEVLEPTPALVQLTSGEDYFKQLKGVRAKGKVTLTADCGENGEETTVCSDKGEIQFTEHGVSGICVFNISGRATRLMYEKKKCHVIIDLFPEISEDELKEILMLRLERSKHKSCEDYLNGMINKKLIPVVMKACGVKKLTDKAEKITEEQVAGIADFMKNWSVEINGSKSWNDAQTTSGGVVLEQVNPHTMESKLVAGLYFAGEVLDVDGKCGGYNLQWGWSSGVIAGRSASESKEDA